MGSGAGFFALWFVGGGGVMEDNRYWHLDDSEYWWFNLHRVLNDFPECWKHELVLDGFYADGVFIDLVGGE